MVFCLVPPPPQKKVFSLTILKWFLNLHSIYFHSDIYYFLPSVNVYSSSSFRSKDRYLFEKCALYCSMHSEAKQTEMFQFGTEKGLLRGEWGSLCLKSTNYPMVFWEEFLQANFGGRAAEVCDLLLVQ